MNIRLCTHGMLGVLLGSSLSLNGALTPAQLRCEYLINPLAIDARAPRLSWIVESNQRGQVQKAYQVRVASSRKQLRAGAADRWDSGRVESDESLHIVYAGQPLRSRMRAVWQVRVWDQDDRASDWSAPADWQMGLLEPADWQAQWIRVTNQPLPAAPPNFGFHSQTVKTAATNQWVIVDLGATQRVDGLRLHPAHPQPWDTDTVDYLFPRRFWVDAGTDTHFVNAQRLVNRTDADSPLPGSQPLELRFEAVTARYVRLTVTNLPLRGGIYHAFALAELQVLAGEKNRALHAPVQASAYFENGTWSPTNLTDGVLVSQRGGPAEPAPAPMFRKSFTVGQAVARAMLYATAQGLYELRLNGRRVGEQCLAPEWTDYHTRIQYQAHDVTESLRIGENVLGAMLGEGWYAGRIGMSDWMDHKFSRVYGDQPALLAQLEITFADGTRQVVATDASWRATTEGPIRASDLVDGELYDARYEMPGWDAPGLVESPPGTNGWAPVATRAVEAGRLVAQPNEPIRAVLTLAPVALTEPHPGVYVFDLGQNMVGWCRLKLDGPAGTEVTLRHAEVLNDDGTVYVANLRGAPQMDRYVMRDDGAEVWEPRFTCHGFRYVEVTGLPSRPKRSALTGVVVTSAAPEVSRFECSDPMLSQLWQNIRWTQRANLVSVPTDCPQRDERLGWMGDIQAFCQTAMFNMDLAAFMTKWMQDIRDAQADDGRYPDFAPHPFGRNRQFTGVPAWGDAGVIVPWRAYVNYADRRLIEQHYASAKQWVDFIRARNPDGLWRHERGNCYNDWLNGDTVHKEGWPDQGGSVPKDVFATAFFAHSTDLVARMARVLGHDAEANQYAGRFAAIKAAFNRQFVEADGRIQGDTQAGYALALHFNLLPEPLRPVVMRHLVANVATYGGHLSTGIQTTHRLLLELARHGHADTAWQMLTNRTFPSWGFTIDNGATTIWERWDGYVPGRGFQDRGMNSFNHWALGSVGEWLMRHVLGINPDETQPGYKHIVIRPRPGGGVRWARGHFDSIRGRIECAWDLEANSNSNFELDLTVPANTTATVYLPADAADAVREGGRPVTRVRETRLVRMEEGCAVVAVGSGRYHFGVRSSHLTFEPK